MRRLKLSQVEAVRQKLSAAQGHICPMCKQSIRPGARKDGCLDHDHDTGYIRGVLCRNCNQMEGKIHNITKRMGKHLTKTEALQNLLDYWALHITPQYGGIFHHTHMTEEEKRLKRNARARVLRARKK